MITRIWPEGEPWHTSAISGVKRLKEKDPEFKASLGSPVRPRLKNETTMNCSCLQSTAYLSWIYIQNNRKHDMIYVTIILNYYPEKDINILYRKCKIQIKNKNILDFEK